MVFTSILSYFMHPFLFEKLHVLIQKIIIHKLSCIVNFCYVFCVFVTPLSFFASPALTEKGPCACSTKTHTHSENNRSQGVGELEDEERHGEFSILSLDWVGALVLVVQGVDEL